MKRRSLFPALLIAACIATWFATRWYREAALEREAAATATTRMRSAAGERAILRQKIAQLEAAPKTVKPARLTSTAEASPPVAKKPGKNFLELIRTDPRVQSLYLAYQRTGILAEYGPFLLAAHLSAEQRDAFVANLQRRSEEESDIQAAMLQQHLTYEDQEVQKLMRQQMDAHEARQKAALGDDTYAALKTYERDKPGILLVNSIAGSAIVNGIPLSSEQMAELSRVVNDASRDPVKDFYTGATDWARVDRQAAAFLTPQQLSFIQSNEAIGPLGHGWRFQQQLNNAITNADREDTESEKTEDTKTQATP
jgi:hypothetical protein